MLILETFFLFITLYWFVTKCSFMTLRTQTFTILPALFFFIVSSYLAFLTSQVADSSLRQGLLTLTLSFFAGGSVLSIHWFYSWIISGRNHESKKGVTPYAFSLSNLICLLLMTLGSITLVWVGQLTLYDMTTWGKDINRIFFSSRTAEYMFPTLGIDMRVIHYFLIGLTLLLAGLAMFLRRRLRKCPHHFGYLASYPKKVSTPKKCLLCPKVADCMAIATRMPGQPEKQKSLVKLTAMKEKDSPKSPQCFGYLRSLPNSQAVPQECITCRKLLECRNLI